MKHFQKKSGIIPYAAVFAVAVLVYVNALGGSFVFDDERLGFGDPDVYGLSRLGDHVTGEEGYHKTMGRYYRPLVSISFIADAAWGEALFNDPRDPRPYHATNLLIHALASVLVLRLLVLVFRDRAAALAAALIFAVHPIHTEAVSWISGRTDSLAGLFYAGALALYVRYAAAGGAGRLAALLACFVAALASKEMAATLPAAVLLYDFTLGRGGAAALKKRLGVYASLAAILVLFVAWREHVLRDVAERPADLYFHGESWVTTAATMLQTLPVYARLLFVPTGLIYHYDGVLPMPETFLAPEVLLSLAFVVVTLAAAWMLRRRGPAVTFSIVFFYIALLPVLNILPTQSLMAERFLYIPSMSVAVLLADALAAARRPAARLVLYGAAATLILIFGSLTFERNKVWRTDESLYKSAEGTPGTAINVNLGNIYARGGNFDRAEDLYREALALDKEDPGVLLSLGALYYNRGVQKAVIAGRARRNGEIEAAGRLDEDAQRDWETAADFLDKAYRLNPQKEGVLFTLAVLCEKRGMTAEAIRYLEELQAVSPGFRNSSQLLDKLRQ